MECILNPLHYKNNLTLPSVIWSSIPDDAYCACMYDLILIIVTTMLIQVIVLLEALYHIIVLIKLKI